MPKVNFAATLSNQIFVLKILDNSNAERNNKKNVLTVPQLLEISCL